MPNGPQSCMRLLSVVRMISGERSTVELKALVGELLLMTESFWTSTWVSR